MTKNDSAAYINMHASTKTYLQTYSHDFLMLTTIIMKQISLQTYTAVLDIIFCIYPSPTASMLMITQK